MNSGVFLGKTSTTHIEFWFKFDPAEVHELTFLWFGLPEQLLIRFPFSKRGRPPNSDPHPISQN